MNDTHEWIFSGNVKKVYDHISAFSKYKTITWAPIPKGIKAGNFVYIYTSGDPYKEIKYKCVVEKIGIAEADQLGNEYWISVKEYGSAEDHMNIKLICEFNDPKLKLGYLKEKCNFHPPINYMKVGQKLSEILNNV